MNSQNDVEQLLNVVQKMCAAQIAQNSAKVSKASNRAGKTPNKGKAGRPLTAVFDLDATLIDEEGAPIPPSVKLVKSLQRKGVKCFVVTARTSDNFEDTRQEVARFCRDNGLTTGMGVYCMPLESIGSASLRAMSSQAQYKLVARYKQAMRWLVHLHEGPLLLAMGDQLWDVRVAPSTELERDTAGYLEYDPNEAQLLSAKLPRAVTRRWVEKP
jgi:hypothetical protein